MITTTACLVPITITTKQIWLFIYEMKINGVKITANHRFLDLHVDIKPKKYIFWYTARRIAEITGKEYFVASLLQDDKGQVRSCRKIKAYLERNEDAITATVTLAGENPMMNKLLYPNLSEICPTDNPL